MAFPETSLGLRIEAAFGAGTTSPLTWTWTDLTDRLISQSIRIRRGRADESSTTQPSSVRFELRNLDGALTPLNEASPFFPDIVRGTPVRIWVEGQTPALYVPGIDGANASTPNTADLNVPGDLDVRIRVEPDQWAGDTVTDAQVLVAKQNGSSNRSWSFQIFPRSHLVADYTTPSGSTASSLASATQAFGLRPVWVGFTITIDNGAGGKTIRYYRSEDVTPPADITAWEAMGSQTSLFGGILPLSVSTADVEIGTFNAGLPDFRGRVLAAEIRAGINGTVVAAPDFTAQSPGVTSFVDSTGKTWSVNGDAQITTDRIRFVGRIDEILPTWPHGDNNANSAVPTEARVNVTASGPLRRLTQGAKPLKSTLRRAITSTLVGDGYRAGDFLFAYWPCEDGDQAATLAAGIDGLDPISLGANVKAAQEGTLPGATALPTITANQVGSWTATVPPPTSSSASWIVDWVFRVPEATGAEVLVLEVATEGTAGLWQVSVSNAVARIRVLYPGLTEIVTNAVPIGGVIGPWVVARLRASDVTMSGQISYGLNLVPIDGGPPVDIATFIAGPGNVWGRVTGIAQAAAAPPGGMSFGHIAVHQNLFVGTDWLNNPAVGWIGESAAHRFWRLCFEEKVPAEIIGDPTLTTGSLGDLELSEPMGPQRRRSLVDLLNECVTVDQGVLIERRRAPGLMYRTRQNIEGQENVGAAIDATQPGQLQPPFEPRYDDQRLRNDITVASIDGSSARAFDQASIDTEGVYDEEIEIVGVGGVLIPSQVLAAQPGLAAAATAQNNAQAQRRLHFGTWPEMRYPAVVSELGTSPELIEDYHTLELGDRVTIEGLPEQHPTGTVELLLEQTDETIRPTSWTPRLTCSPGGPWLNPVDGSGALSVTGHEFEYGLNEQTVTNPGQGTGNTLVFLSVAPSPGIEPTGGYVEPPGATLILDYPGDSFVQRVRIWTKTEAGETDFTFGWNGPGAITQTSAIIALSGLAVDVRDAGPEITAGPGSISSPYPALSTVADMLVLTVATQQVSDELTAGPAGAAELFNNTPQTATRGAAVHSLVASSGSTTPSDATWDNGSGAHVQFTLGFHNVASVNAPLAAGQWTVYIDPDNPNSWNQNRPDCQLITAGNRWNPGDVTDGVNDPAGGYGLFLDSASEIHSFSAGGSSLRFGSRPVTGLANGTNAIITRHIWVNDGSYNEASETPQGQNNSTTWPGIDRTYFDGTRTHMACIPTSAADPKAIQASHSGATGDRVFQSTAWRVEDWMLGADLNAAGGGIHAPAAGIGSPFTSFIGEAELKIITRQQAAPYTAGSPSPPSTVQATIPITPADVGSWWATVYDFIIDPTDGYLRVYLNKGDGAGMTQIVNITGGYGYAYANGDPNNDVFYSILMSYYSWHRFTNDPVNAPNNWDPTYGIARTMAFAYSGMIVDPEPQGIDIADVLSHANYFIDG